MSSVSLKNIAKNYGKVNVLKGINLDIEEGELIVFVGPSGCGKSTLLRMIAGLEEITSGSLYIDDKIMNEVPPSKRGIAMVFQSYALYPHMTVYDNMSFGMKIARVSKQKIDKRVREAAKILQLEDYLERLPKALSGGQRQRVAIGRAIVRNPKVFLFDEPLSNLDAALRVATRIEIAQLKDSMPKSTMIYVTHDQVEAMTLATRIVVLSAGSIEQVGHPLTLYEKPANIFVARFIGSPAMNIFSGKIVTSGKTSKVKIDMGETVSAAIPSTASDKGKPIQLGVRPEDLIITKGKEFIFEGTVAIAEGLGEVTQIHFNEKVDGHSIIAKIPGINHIKKNQKLRLVADPAKMHLFDKKGISFLYR